MGSKPDALRARTSVPSPLGRLIEAHSDYNELWVSKNADKKIPIKSAII
jgi:hypothetical protein